MIRHFSRPPSFRFWAFVLHSGLARKNDPARRLLSGSTFRYSRSVSAGWSPGGQCFLSALRANRPELLTGAAGVVCDRKGKRLGEARERIVALAHELRDTAAQFTPAAFENDGPNSELQHVA